jgi:hypothetical protein
MANVQIDSTQQKFDQSNSYLENIKKIIVFTYFRLFLELDSYFNFVIDGVYQDTNNWSYF